MNPVYYLKPLEVTTPVPHAMYIFVNMDLKMDKGKIAGQVGHVVQKIIEHILPVVIKLDAGLVQMENLDEQTRINVNAYTQWARYGMAKIVLKATQAELEELISKHKAFYVRDAGLTQIAPNSLTAVGFCPAPKSTVQELVSGFKLL